MKFHISVLTCLVAAFICVIPPASSFGAIASEDEDAIRARTLEGQTLIFARRYDEAMELFKKLSHDYPRVPTGPFGQMAVLEVRMLEREDLHLEDEFTKAARVGRARVGKVLQRYRPTPWQLYSCGSLLGLEGFFKARKGEWWGAYTAGTKSRQLFRRVKKLDPDYVDADFGLGMYLYWRSVFSRDLWFLRFIPDKRKEAIAIVERVATHGRFAKDLARVSLAVIYFEEKRYDEAEKILNEYVSRYPENVILRRLLGKVLVAKRRYDAAVEQFRTVLKIDASFKKPHYFIGATLVRKGDPARFAEAERELNHFLEIQGGKYWPASAHYWLGRLAEKRGDKELAKREYKKALSLRPKIGDALRRVRGLGGGI